MSAVDLIAAIEDCGGRVFLREGGIKLTAKRPLPDDLVARLKSAKSEIVTFLQRQEISVHDGGKSETAFRCQQCCEAITDDDEFINSATGGVRGRLHERCYRAWYDAHLRGRYPGS